MRYRLSKYSLLVVAIIMLTIINLWCHPVAYAGAVTISYYPQYIPGDGGSGTTGTPFALYVTYTGGSANASCRIKAYCYGGSYGSTSKGYTWNPASSTWVYQTALWNSQREITTDGSGNWSGWIHVKIPPGDAAGSATLKVRVRDNDTNYDGTVTVTVMDMSTSGDGGWVEETTGTARAGRAVVVKSGTNIVGMYIAEDNGVDEGYSGTGYYKIAVPTCSTCNYSIETWDLSDPGTAVGQTNFMPDQEGDNTVSAGQTTTLNFSTPTVITLAFLEARSSGQTAHMRWLIAALAGLVAVGASIVALQRRRAA